MTGVSNMVEVKGVIQYTMKVSPKVSVIMNCLNCGRYLCEAIDSVYAQTYKDWEIIFWDNASIDNSAEIVKSYDDRLKYFRGDKTVPLYAARNLALKQAKGEYIAFLDCDDLWLSTKLEKQLKLFSREKVGLVFCNTFFMNQKTGNERVLYNKKPLTGMIFRQLLSNYFLSLQTVLIRRKCLDRLTEWFDDRFDMVGDVDLFTRIAFDWELDYVDDPLAKWRIHGDNMTFKKMGLFGKELLMMLDKYKRLYSNFQNNYKEEIKNIKARAAYYEAVEEWKTGNGNKSRKIILPHIANNPKFLIVYLISVLPYKKYANILRFVGRYVLTKLIFLQG